MRWVYLALLILIGGASKGWSLTLSDLITRSRLYLKDTSALTNRQRFSDTQITSFINDGQSEVNARTWSVVNSTTIGILAGTTEYILPPDFVVPVRVTVNNVPIPERTLSFLDSAESSWVGDPSSNIREYYIRVDSPNFTTAREAIGVHPVSSATATMLVQYVAQPTLLSNSSDIPFNGAYRLTPFHQALAYYAAYRGYLIIGDTGSAAVYLKDYMDLMTVMESDDRVRALFNPNIRGLLAAPSQPK